MSDEMIDVLAVMDAACCVLAIDKCADPQKQLEKARAAIAELIEAAKSGNYDLITAALARVGATK